MDLETIINQMSASRPSVQSEKYYAPRIHERKKGPGRSKGMKPKSFAAGSKFAKAFKARVATLRCKFSHHPKG
ncbi:hypothetical protein SAMN05216302_101472 [Nitrosomonas aestuarii]|uniref:Uncharacterized protein n=1 Tax=Nitrosomonas aestuarii TaxID=52441 RepID=A0A1I4C3D1_9PROT|nr:hypothetical protein [Nitrosomonas aestuarii]SFK75445.1 hypothetical protein SAMN05216302_101472 [Nitrosomonas aestuarii]